MGLMSCCGGLICKLIEGHRCSSLGLYNRDYVVLENYMYWIVTTLYQYNFFLIPDQKTHIVEENTVKTQIARTKLCCMVRFRQKYDAVWFEKMSNPILAVWFMLNSKLHQPNPRVGEVERVKLGKIFFLDLPIYIYRVGFQ